MDSAVPLSDRERTRATEGHHGGRTERAQPSRRLDRSTLAVTAAVTATLGIASRVGSLPVASIVGLVLLVPAAVADVRTRRLPDRWVAAAGVATLGVWLTAGAIPAVGDLALGIAVTAGPLLVLHLAAPAAMGFGDVKAAAVLGVAVAMIDWQLGLVVLAVASGTAAAVSVVRRRSTVAFGPYLIGAAWVVVLASTVEWVGR